MIEASDRENTLGRMFVGYLCATVPELHNVEVPLIGDHWEEFKKRVNEKDLPPGRGDHFQMIAERHERDADKHKARLYQAWETCRGQTKGLQRLRRLVNRVRLQLSEKNGVIEGYKLRINTAIDERNRNGEALTEVCTLVHQAIKIIDASTCTRELQAWLERAKKAVEVPEPEPFI